MNGRVRSQEECACSKKGSLTTAAIRPMVVRVTLAYLANSENPAMTYNHMTASLSKSRLGELMERNGVTRAELAELLRSSPKTLEAIEKGDYDPPLSLAYKIAAALKVPVERLYTD